MKHLSAEQQAKAESFYARHLPGQAIGVIRSSSYTGRETYLGINYAVAAVFSGAAFEGILRQHPKITQTDFDNEMIERVGKLNKLAESFEQRGFKKANKISAHGFVGALAYEMGLLGVPFNDQIKSIRLNVKLIPRWLALVHESRGDFSFKNRLGGHVETPISMEVHLGPERVATAGGFVYYRDGKPTLRLNNIQGVKGPSREPTANKKTGRYTLEPKASFEPKLSAHLAKYTALDSELGENWRVHLAKRAISIARQNKWGIEAEVPRKFSGLGDISASRYANLCMHARQTYKKAGLKEKDEDTWVLPE